MLRIHRIAFTRFRTWGPDITEPEPDFDSTSPTKLTPDQSFIGACAYSWVDVDEGIDKVSASGRSTPNSGDSRHLSAANIKSHTPVIVRRVSDTAPACEPQTLDTTTFPAHASHLLPSAPNGTWRTSAYYAIKNPSGTASTLRGVLKQYAHELDANTLLHKLEQVAEDRKDDLDGWLNQTFQNYDLVEMHNRVRSLVPVLSMPGMRQLDRTVDHVVDMVSDTVQMLRKRRSEPGLLDADLPGDKYAFARIMGQKGRDALIEQGVCKEWQFLGEEHAKLQHSMHSALMHTFIRIQQLHKDVPLFQAKPRWLADGEKRVWRLELDVGIVGVKVGPEIGVASIELGFIDTGFGLPESCGCVSIADVERQAREVEDDWQLLGPST